MDWGTGTTSLGSCSLKEKPVVFGIKDEDRLKHVCVLGRNGSGRGEFISRMAFQDIARGLGLVILDANGNVGPYMLERCDPSIADRLVFLDPAEAEYPYTWNVIDDVRKLPEHVQETYLVRLLKSVYQLSSTEVVKRVAPLLLKKESTTLVTLYDLIAEEERRKEFFEKDMDELSAFGQLLQAHEQEVNDIIENGRYIAKDTLIRNLLGQSESKFSVSDIAEGKIIIVNFEKIRMYPTRMTPLVRAFVEAALMASETSTQPGVVYLQDSLRYLGDDEIERAFGSSRIALTVADTVIQESDRERREQALARCGSIASFAIHPLDRPLIERAFYPYIDPEELEHLEERELIMALTIDAVRTRPFFASSLPMDRVRTSSYQDLIVASREKYTTSRVQVDEQFKSKDGEGRRPKKPSGFQDAFRAMFDKRAAAGGAGQAPKPQAAAPKEEVDKKPETGKVEQKPDKETPAQGEVPEDALKRMVYVPAVS